MHNVRRLTGIMITVFLCTPGNGQRYVPADPFNLMFQEKAYFLNGEDHGSLLIRPLFLPRHNPGSNWTLTVRSELFDNDGAPNLENTSDRWIGKGRSFFSSFNISYNGKFIAFSVEPFYFTNQNENYDVPRRIDKYSKLNDSRVHGESPYTVDGLRESQVYLHYRGIGVGISNANMWWGPGIHSTLNMTNNAPGFKYLMIGTLQEQRIRNVSFDIRYIFSEMDSLNAAEPYYTALVLATTLHSDPVVTIGLSRTYLTGGNRTQETITKKDAMGIALEGLFLESKQTDPDDPTSSLDIWDQTLSGYLSASFPASGLKIFLELGRNDHAFDGTDLRRQPDHTAASVVGLRKYGLFGNKNLTFGIEYANLLESRYVIGSVLSRKRAGADWYDRWQYDFSSYDGRHWAAHSGPDSDDFTVYLGYLGNTFSIIPAFNYERHGVIDNRILRQRAYLVRDPDTGEIVPRIEWVPWKNSDIWPEVKFEFRLDIRYAYRGFQFNLYYEREFVDNLEFRKGKRESEVIWVGVERVFDGIKVPRFLSWF